MSNIYKVSAATINKTKNGYELFSLHLNNFFWATKLVPLGERNRRWDTLYQLYDENDKSLEFLVGRYISVHLEETSFGKNFNSIASFDVVEEFKSLLDLSNASGAAFWTRINMYDFLESKGYPLNSDGTITLRKPYSQFNIKATEDGNGTICFLNEPREGTLTLENLKIIYDNFFRGKPIDTSNPDRSEEYILNPVAIVKRRRSYHKTKSGKGRTNYFNILTVGEELSDEQWQFLTETTQAAEPK